MKKVTIEVPPNKLLSTLISNRCSNHSDCTKISFDLSSYSSFLEPKHIVTLSAFIEEYLNQGKKVELKFKNTKSRKYIKDIGLLPYVNGKTEELDYQSSNKKTSISIWNILNTEAIQSYSDYAKDYFETYFLHGNSLESLHISLSELFNNIFDHSESKIGGFVHTQYYPNLNKLKTAVCDLGIGIPYSLNKAWQKADKNKLNDSDAIRASVKKKVTTKSNPRNRGFGLSNIFLQTNKLNGNIYIYSGKGFLYNKFYKINTKTLPYKFPGTLIYLTLDTTKLPESEDYLDETFSFS